MYGDCAGYSGHVADFGDVRFLWSGGPGLAHAAGHLRNTDKGKRSAYTHRLVTILDSMRVGQMSDEDGVHQILLTTAAFLTRLSQQEDPVTVSVSPVGEESIDQPESSFS